jgi:MFS family permease
MNRRSAPVPNANDSQSQSRPSPYAWLVLALVFGLLLSDYMSRQVLNAVYPLLKADWHLSDAQLGWLSGVVALTVGVLTVPLSFLADRVGRIRAIGAMAIVWSLATLLCAVAQDFPQMLGARLLVGMGEAAYGGVGLALLRSVFPVRMRGTVSALFLAGAIMGQVLGVGLGGLIATTWNWRAAFAVMGMAGLVLAAAFLAKVRPERIAREAKQIEHREETMTTGDDTRLGDVLRNVPLLCACVAGGFQFYIAGALPAWLPTYFVRYHFLALDAATSLASLYLLLSGLGMVFWGNLSDRLAGADLRLRARHTAYFCLASAFFIGLAFQLSPGTAQMIALAAGMFLSACTTGPCSALVSGWAPPGLLATALALMALCFSLLGLAPGPILTGAIADRIGLLGALQFLPIASLLAAAFLAAAAKASTSLR